MTRISRATREKLKRQERISSAEISENHRNLFLSNYGSFLALWSSFDVLIEILIMRQLGTTEEKTSIVCAGLVFGTKVNILYSLLNRDPKNAEGVKLIKQAQQSAERNRFAHGFFRVDRPNAIFTLIKREVKEKYTATAKHYDLNKIIQHTDKFSQAFSAVTDHFGLSVEDMDSYTTQIEDHASAPKSQGKHRP